jgi:catechol 2,3-dioxygenase-like lactoylglutathione lyase family enzyme
MKTTHALQCGVLFLTLLAGAAPRAAGTNVVKVMTFDNLHIRVPDPQKAAQWYVKHLGATQAPSAWRIYFGRTVIVFGKAENAPPSAGSAIDHFAMSVANVTATVNDLRAAGAAVVKPQPGDGSEKKDVFVDDPWGVRIEILNDPSLVGFHHVHLKVTDPQSALAWYEETFGGIRENNRRNGLRYGTVWLLADRSEARNVAASADHAIQLMGFQIQNRDTAVEALKRKGVSIVNSGVSTVEGQPVPWAFVDDPNGARIELLQRPN